MDAEQWRKQMEHSDRLAASCPKCQCPPVPQGIYEHGKQCLCCGYQAAATVEQPPPDPTSIHPAVWDLVREDMVARDRLGQQRYGTRLRGFNGRDALRDLYEELLDSCVYARQALYERDHR